MQIQINAADPQTRNADEDMIRGEVHKALDRFEGRITRVEVHVRDVNGPRGGNDKQCTMEARLTGLNPMTATANGAELGAAVVGAAGKLRRVIHDDLDRRNERR